MQNTLHLEKCVNQSLLNLHKLATDSSDVELYYFLGTDYLDQQVKFIRELRDHLSDLSNMGLPEGALAEYFSDKLTLRGGDKKDWAWTGLSPESGVTAQGHPACNADRSIALAEKVHKFSFFQCCQFFQ